VADPVVAMVGFPTDRNSSFARGPARAPREIRRSLLSAAGNSCTESGLDLQTPGVMADFGDAALAESTDDAATITEHVRAHLEHGRRVLSLGGDHSITYPIIRGYMSFAPHLSIVHLDAHPDLYPAFGGNRWSHASPFARILEDTTVRQLVQVGIRTMTPEQLEVAGRHGVRVFNPDQLEAAVAALPGGPVYVSLDLDALDPAFAPGVSHREPGGLSVREVLRILAHIPGVVIGADVVELNPEEDCRGLTATVAAKLAKELIDRMFRDASRPLDA
jgi:arginase